MKAQATIPTFSLVLETENLSAAAMECVTSCLDSLESQDLPVTEANEVVVLDNGRASPELLDQLTAAYPWITVRKIPPGKGYYDAKVQSVAHTTGDVVVFCDSDCIYVPNWLRTIVTTFSERPDVQAVAGETTTLADGPYGVAMAQTYIFPRYSRHRELYPAMYYSCNNVAFRRDVIDRYPIPLELPLYRGNCVVHARTLKEAGITLWKQPEARAAHALPNGAAHFFWRFLLMGHDRLSFSRAPVTSPDTYRYVPRWLRGPGAVAKITLEKTRELVERTVNVVRENPRHVAYLPLAAPVTAAATALFFAGMGISYFKPEYLQARAALMEHD